MLPWTILTKYCLQAHQHTAEVTPLIGMKGQHLGTIAPTGTPTAIIETGTGTVIPDLSHTILDIGVQAVRTPIEVTPDCFTDPHIVVPLITEAQACTATAMITTLQTFIP